MTSEASQAAHAHSDRDRAQRMAETYDAGLSVPFVSSPIVRLADTRPGSAEISGFFLHSAPYFVMSGLDDVTVYAVSGPVAPPGVPGRPRARQRPGTYPVPAGAFCSVHWFDFHLSVIAAVGSYGGGTQLIDVTDLPEDPPGPLGRPRAWPRRLRRRRAG